MPGTTDLCDHIECNSQLGRSLQELCPTLMDCITKANIWRGPWTDRWDIETVLQVIWHEARGTFERLRMQVNSG